ncbi:MAG: hypothetical protein DRP51_06065 [Candidatus Zixiibacteriota bacterium]|nr:MAG: hypothetical protein DRP51_06065 [candidate division Zixibacteria bacterium]
MAMVLCKHNLNTTKFLAKIHDEGKVIIHLKKSVPVEIDERIAAQYPSTFEIIEVKRPRLISTVPAPEADVEEIKAEDETATDEPEIVEPEESFAVNLVDESETTDGKTLVDVFSELDEEGMFPDEEIELSGETDEEPDKVNENEVKAELLAAINGFKNKKALDEYAAGLGVELDRRKTLKDMKADLKEAWSL